MTEEEKICYMIVAGSSGMYEENNRSYNQKMKEMVWNCIERLTKKGRSQGYKFHLVEGNEPGTDRYASDFAIENGLSLTVIPADWRDVRGMAPSQLSYDREGAYDPRAGVIRDNQRHHLINKHKSRFVLCFWDGKTEEVKHHITVAERTQTSLLVYNYEKKQWFKGREAYALVL